MTDAENIGNETKIADKIKFHCQYAIRFFGILTVIVLIIAGYSLYCEGVPLFLVPLFVAFLTIVIAYLFIDLRSVLAADNKENAIALCDNYFMLLVVATIAVGVFTGYFFHNAEYEKMFLPLFVAFMTVVSAYIFIEFKGELVADKSVDKY